MTKKLLFAAWLVWAIPWAGLAFIGRLIFCFSIFLMRFSRDDLSQAWWSTD